MLMLFVGRVLAIRYQHRLMPSFRFFILRIDPRGFLVSDIDVGCGATCGQVSVAHVANFARVKFSTFELIGRAPCTQIHIRGSGRMRVNTVTVK